MSTFRIECGACSQPLEADVSMAGRRVRCPRCKQVVQLPPAEALLPEIRKDAGRPAPPEGDRPGTDGGGTARSRKEETRRRSRGKTTIQPRRDTTLRRRIDEAVHAGEASSGGPPAEGARPRFRRRRTWIAPVAGLAVFLLIAAFAGILYRSGNTGGAEEKKTRREPIPMDVPRASPAPEPAPVPEPEPESPMEEYVLTAELEEFALEIDLPPELVRSNGKKFDPERLAELRAIEKEYREKVMAEVAHRRDDPFYDAVQQVKSSLLSRKGLDKFSFRVKRLEPYVVFEQVDEGAAGSDPQVERKLEQKLRMLRREFDIMKSRWMDPYGLSMDPRLPLLVISLKNREAYRRLHEEMGESLPSGALAYFSRIHTYIILYNQVEGKSNATLIERADNDGTVFHEGSHQIVNAFINKGRGFNSLGTVNIPFWVSEGLAEYMGSVAITGKKDAEGFDVHDIGVPNPMRLAEFWQATHPHKSSGIPPYYLDLWDLVECYNQSEIVNLVKRKVGDALKAHAARSPRWRYVEAACVSMVYAEASSFFLFCYEFDGGRYASGMDRYLEKAFRGLHDSKFLLEAFGVEDLKKMNGEWLAYVESVTPEWVKKASKKGK